MTTPNPPLKAGDYTTIDSVRIDYTNALGDLDASTIIDPKEYDTTSVSTGFAGQEIIEKPIAGNYFNLSETEGSTGGVKNYWSANKDVVFYLIQAGKTDGVIWTFIAAPSNITIAKNMDYTAEQNWAANERTITYGGTAMKKISLGEILIEGLITKANIQKKVNQLEKLLDPVQYKKHIAPLVFELIVKPKNGQSQESRSYGYYIITDVGLSEILRDHSGRALRVVANLELQEIPKYQINNGRDLTLPDNLIVKVDKTAKEQLNEKKEEKPDGSTTNDIKEGNEVRRDTFYIDKNGKRQKGIEVERTNTINGKPARSNWIEDTNGNRVTPINTTIDTGNQTKVNKVQPGSSNLVDNYTTDINIAPTE